MASNWPRSSAQRLTIFTVTLPFRLFTAEKILAPAAAVATAAGVPVETVAVEDDHPYQSIINTAESKGADLIVMSSHGRGGVSALILGSETAKVLTHCKIPVLVHR
jgi:nucleotide-binding universal stress UspA family protein